VVEIWKFVYFIYKSELKNSSFVWCDPRHVLTVNKVGKIHNFKKIYYVFMEFIICGRHILVGVVNP